MKRFTEGVIAWRGWVILIVLVITGVLGFQILKLQVNSDVIDSLPDTDPDAVLLKEIGDKFGGNRIGMVILETEDIFQNEVLTYVTRITDTLSLRSDISAITSMTTMVEIKNDAYGFEVGTLVDPYDLPLEDEALINLRERVMANELYRGSIVSADGTGTTIIFTLAQGADVEEISAYVLDKTREMNLPVRLYYAGTPIVVTSVARIISRDMQTLIPITFVIISLILFLGFRTLRGVFLPLISSAFAIVWTIGLMALGGFQMSMVSSNVPILLLAIGSAYSIHVINRVRQVQLTDSNASVGIALTYIAIPVFLSAVTTAAGFISFLFGAYLTMIRDYGLFTAIGTLISCILSLTFVPAVMSYSRHSGMAKAQDLSDRSVLARFVLAPVNSMLVRHRARILVVWGALIVVSIGGMLLIRREVDIKDYFQKNNPTRVAEEIMTEKFGGTKPVFVRFKGDIQDPAVLNAMLDLEAHMKQSPDILSTQSVANLITQLNEALGNGNTIPETRNMIEQLWFLLDGNPYLANLISEDLDEAVVVSKFVNTDNASKIKFREYMKTYMAGIDSDQYEVEITGMPFVDITLDNSLVRSQIGSLIFATLFVVLIVGWILRSLPLGLLATAPIIAAILILFGMMGYTGIPLNIGTVLVASVALGIGIDYSIHMITHYRHALRQGLTLQAAIEDAIMISGKGIMINVASVSAGFLVLIFSQMVPLQYFGLLVAISMVGSSLGALTLLPVLLMIQGNATKRVNLKHE